MDRIWKWIMNLNAKAFCLVAAIIFIATAAWCVFSFQTPPKPFQHGSETLTNSERMPCMGMLEFVSNQLADTTLSIPTDPFRPTLEAIFTNETERAAFIKALRDAQARAAGLQAPGTDNKREDPFAHLRNKTKVPDGTLVDAAGRPMVVPKLTFLGFVQRPDGTKAAMFHDSVANTTFFYDTGQQQVRGVDITNADVRQAEIRFPDGTVRNLEIGGTIELAAEPAPPPKPGAAKPAPANVKPGAANAKPGAANAKPGAGRNPQAAQRPGNAQPRQRPGAKP